MTTTTTELPEVDDPLAFAYLLRETVAMVPEPIAYRDLATARHLIEVNGLSPECVGAALGVGVDSVRAYMAGRRHPDPVKWQKLLSVLGARAGWLGLPTEPDAAEPQS